MIVQWLIQVATGFAGWLATLFPPITIPSWVTGMQTGIVGFLSNAAGLGAWIPYALIFTVAGSVIAIYGVAFLAKLVRVIIAHVPFIGGSG